MMPVLTEGVSTMMIVMMMITIMMMRLMMVMTMLIKIMKMKTATMMLMFLNNKLVVFKMSSFKTFIHLFV